MKAYEFPANVTDEGKTVIARPLSLIGSIRIEKLDKFNLFKFNDELQAQMEELLERKKADLLTPEEAIELEEIG
ncbi:MAG: hypothetical protein ACYTXT_14140 [Nostoc sp.]